MYNQGPKYRPQTPMWAARSRYGQDFATQPDRENPAQTIRAVWHSPYLAHMWVGYGDTWLRLPRKLWPTMARHDRTKTPPNPSSTSMLDHSAHSQSPPILVASPPFPFPLFHHGELRQLLLVAIPIPLTGTTS